MADYINNNAGMDWDDAIENDGQEFIILPEGKKPPAYIAYLGTVLPCAVIGFLVIYCMKGAVFTDYHGLPELISIVFIIVLHKWKKNTLLSIGAGTILYMVLVQNVFIQIL